MKCTEDIIDNEDCMRSIYERMRFEHDLNRSLDMKFCYVKTTVVVFDQLSSTFIANSFSQITCMLVSSGVQNVSTGWTYYLPASQLTRGCEKYRDNDECTFAKVVQVGTTFVIVEWQLPSDHSGVTKRQSTYLQVIYVASAERKQLIQQ